MEYYDEYDGSYEHDESGQKAKKCKLDQVNNANSVFIFMINLLIIQGCQSGSFGWGGHLVRLVRLVW